MREEWNNASSVWSGKKVQWESDLPANPSRPLDRALIVVATLSEMVTGEPSVFLECRAFIAVPCCTSILHSTWQREGILNAEEWLERQQLTEWLMRVSRRLNEEKFYSLHI